MPKQVYCAKCGTELLMQLKAVPAEGKVICVVEPHTCDVKTVMEIVERDKGIAEAHEKNYGEENKTKLAGPSEVMFEETEEAGEKDLKVVGSVSGRITSKSNIAEEAKEELSKKAKVAALFDDFPFVKKLNKEAKEHEVPEAPGDMRDKKFHREELITSSAPDGVRILSKSTVGETKTEDNREMEEPEDEQS